MTSNDKSSNKGFSGSSMTSLTILPNTYQGKFPLKNNTHNKVQEATCRSGPCCSDRPYLKK